MARKRKEDLTTNRGNTSRDGSQNKAGPHDRMDFRKSKNEIYPDSDISIRGVQHEETKFGTHATVVAASHFFKALLSPTILVMPGAFRSGGILFSVVGYLFMVILISYNLKRMVICADYLSQRENLDIRTYDQVAFVSLDTCSDTTRHYAKNFRALVNIMFVITNIDSMSIFMIFIARNIMAMEYHYYPDNIFNVRYFIFFQMMILLVINSVRQLKYLLPFSIISSALLAISIVLCAYFYFIFNMSSPLEGRLVGDVSIIRFFSIVLFSQSGISIALTMKSSMKNPQYFLGVPGVYCLTVLITCVLYLTFGLMGYLAFGDKTQVSIMLNLPSDENKALWVKFLTFASVALTTPILFFVVFNVLWNNFIKPKINLVNEMPLEYMIRYLLIFCIFLWAEALPTLGPMIVLKGALLHSQLEVIYPPIVEFIAFYPEKGHGRGYCRLIKAVSISLLGVFFCICGTAMGIYDLISKTQDLYE